MIEIRILSYVKFRLLATFLTELDHCAVAWQWKPVLASTHAATQTFPCPRYYAAWSTLLRNWAEPRVTDTGAELVALPLAERPTTNTLENRTFVSGSL